MKILTTSDRPRKKVEDGSLKNPPVLATRLNKRHAVAAQTARSRSYSRLHVYYFTAYQRQRTLYGVGVITKLYFAIFAAFKESMTLNIVQRSFSVIHLGQSKARARLCIGR